MFWLEYEKFRCDILDNKIDLYKHTQLESEDNTDNYDNTDTYDNTDKTDKTDKYIEMTNLFRLYLTSFANFFHKPSFKGIPY